MSATQKLKASPESVPMKYLPVKTEVEDEGYRDSPVQGEVGDQEQDEALLGGNKEAERWKSPPWTKRELIVIGFSLVALALGLFAMAKAVLFDGERRCEEGERKGHTTVSGFYSGRAL